MSDTEPLARPTAGPAPAIPLAQVAPAALIDTIVDLSDDAIFTCNTSGLVTSWSTTAERLFGYAATEVIDEPLDALCSEHLRADVQSVMARVVAGDRVERFETEVLRPDGMPLPVSLSISPILSTAGGLLGTAVIARDVTEQRLTQAALAEVETRLAEGEALAHIGSWLWDLRTGAVQWSAEFHRIHGVDPLDFDGTLESHLGFVHADDRDAVRSAMAESVASGRPFEGSYRVVWPDGRTRVLRVRAQPTAGSSGTRVGLRGVGRDVTDLPLCP